MATDRQIYAPTLYLEDTTVSFKARTIFRKCDEQVSQFRFLKSKYMYVIQYLHSTKPHQHQIGQQKQSTKYGPTGHKALIVFLPSEETYQQDLY